MSEGKGISGDPPPPTDTEALEAAVSSSAGIRYKLRLYIAGPSPKAAQALVNIRRICEQHLKDRYELEVFDLLQNPALAQQDQIIAAPTLAKLEPSPQRRFIGDLSETGRILHGLGLPVPPSQPSDPLQVP